MSDLTVSDITDEEMAKWASMHEPKPGMRILCIWCGYTLPCPTLRLITALRASREEVERLREQYEEVCLTITEG